MLTRPMKIFAYSGSHPRETLAVTDDGENILYGELTDLSGRLGEAVGHRLVFALCRNTPGSLLGYLGLLQSGGVPLLLDAETAPQLLRDLMMTYRPAFCLVPEDLPAQALAVIAETAAMICDVPETGSEAEEDPSGKAAEGDLCGGQPETADYAAAVSARAARPVMRIRDYVLYRTAAEGEDPVLAPELRLLLTTSGSTGSSKLVRISGDNLDANAESIIEYLQITREERPVTVLPMQYSYGMSIIHTHVMAGAPIILTRHTLMERSFWDRVRRDHVTSLCGVPYTFEMYSRLGLMDMDLPDLRYITQAGGKLTEQRHMQYARWCAKKGIRFYVMYGQTEASPRMGWLPPEKAVEKCGSMGIAIPGGRIDLLDEDGRPIPEPMNGKNPDGIRPDKSSSNNMSPVGELVYTGANVALGYALCAADLAKGDEFHGCLRTGDMARRDADDYFYIVGRKKRFIKVGGKRVGLDELEKILRTAFPDLELACAGKDDDLHVYVVAPARENSGPDAGPDKSKKNQAEPGRAGETPEAAGAWTEEESQSICDCIRDMTGIPDRRVTIVPVREIPRSSSGKIRYADLH